MTTGVSTARKDARPTTVRGIDAYDETWDFLFDQPQGQIELVPDDREVTDQTRLRISNRNEAQPDWSL
ncbi:hypothetical protein [Arthrobacter castelli]|uniref:hypothetical protein n=1 Tax=Arthrobacter castelli TaxID=271431 RepID=UPI0004041C2F|nr:hypothetical protein [Arthrobacter castelli]